MNDLISIVLPVYNGETYLSESIDSIIAQTYQNWELIIVDDCSTDSSAQIAQEYVRKDPRIKYYRNEQNLRLPRNLNRGFSLTTGEYLTWTSDDNRYRPNALEVMYDALTHDPQAQFAFASCRIIDGEGRETEHISVGPFSYKRIVGIDSVGACFLYTRKVYETIGDYDHDFILAEDFDYWQRVFQHFKTVAIEEILYDYRLHDNSLTGDRTQNQERKDRFNQTLEKMLRKNRPGFGKLDVEERYYYYLGLYQCRVNRSNCENPYVLAYHWSKLCYTVCCRIPRKIRRMMKL